MISVIENLIFRNRRLVVALFLLMTVFMVWHASHLKIDAGFAKMLPLKHPYMQTYLESRDSFGGANLVVISIKVSKVYPNYPIYTFYLLVVILINLSEH